MLENNINLIDRLVKLQILYIRYMERNYNIQYTSSESIFSVLSNNSGCITYGEAMKQLYDRYIRECRNQNLLKEVGILKRDMDNSSSDLNKKMIANNINGRFTEEERTLNTIRLEKTLLYATCLMPIKEVSSLTGIREAAIKQACQQERLLNTRKVSRIWLVSLNEVCLYWKEKIR